MADEKKQITLLNLRKHPFKTSKGEFKAGHQHAMAFEADEASMLLTYEGVVEASKYAPPSAEGEALKAENAALKEKLSVAVSVDTATVQEALEKANSAIEALKEENEGLTKQIAKLEKALEKANK